MNRPATTPRPEVRPRQSDSWLSATSYWTPSLLVESAWHEHAPFAAWLMNEHRPTTVVELGTHNGFSYFTWCECAVRLGIDTKLTAIDSWEGDEHAGFYSQAVFEAVTKANRQYGDRSTLLRGYFSDRVRDIDDSSVDLLHIDGRHGYQDVKADFELYLPKMSSRGIVLFHDVTELGNGFGVHQFWAEISERHPSFSFEHGHGLGVLFVGKQAAARFSAFLAAAATNSGAIRYDYAALGAVIEQRFQDQESRAREPQLVAARDEAVNELRMVKQTKAWRATAPARFLMAKARLAKSRSIRN